MHDEAPIETPPQRVPQTVGKRLAALSLVGALMVALPLVQLLHYQSAEAESLAAARTGLDPVGRAVDVQRGLLAHRDAAAQVLHGRQSVEPERQLRQAEVDERLSTLGATLASGPWPRAVSESDALREDWLSLARQFAGHSLGAGESDHAHRLLIEQTLQVIDLVADAGAPLAAATLQQLQPTLAVAHALPRLAWQIEQLSSQHPASPVDDITRQRDLATAEAGLARTLGMLNAALVEQPRPALADAGAAAGAATDRYFHLLRSAKTAPGGEHSAELRHAAVTARHAQFALFNQAQADAAKQLEARGGAVQLRSARLIVAMLTMGVMALILAAGTWRSLRRLTAQARASATPHEAEAHQPSQPQQHAGALLDRLRDGRPSDRTRRDPRPAAPSRF